MASTPTRYSSLSKWAWQTVLAGGSSARAGGVFKIVLGLRLSHAGIVGAHVLETDEGLDYITQGSACLFHGHPDLIQGNRHLFFNIVRFHLAAYQGSGIRTGTENHVPHHDRPRKLRLSGSYVRISLFHACVISGVGLHFPAGLAPRDESQSIDLHEKVRVLKICGDKSAGGRVLSQEGCIPLIILQLCLSHPGPVRQVPHDDGIADDVVQGPARFLHRMLQIIQGGLHLFFDGLRLRLTALR